MAGIRSGRAARPDQDVGSFDRRAGSDERDWRSEFHAPVVATAAEVALAALPHPASVLDVGCGTGALLRTLAHRLRAGVALAGVDPAPAMLQVGRARLGQRSRVWLARAVAELKRLLIRARLTPLAWERIYDLGPLPLVRADIAGHWVQPLAASG